MKEKVHEFAPDPKLKPLWFTILALVVIIYLGVAGLILYAVLINAPEALSLATIILIVSLAVWAVPTVVWIPAFYRSLKYVITPSEIVVRKGVLWKRETTVPYHKVTDASTRQGPLERVFGLGRVIIHTAGWSGTARPEAALAGLSNFRGVKEEIMKYVRSLRGGAAATLESE